MQRPRKLQRRENRGGHRAWFLQLGEYFVDTRECRKKPRVGGQIACIDQMTLIVCR